MNTLTRLVLLFIAVFVTVPMVAAHGTGVTYTVSGNSVTIAALFDDDTPMSEAQVIVYAPTDPEIVYLRGVADEDGSFTFDIDTALAGSWDVAVRTAGHGDMLNIPVTESGEIRPMDAGFAIPRQLLAVIVVAALGGVAFIYSRKPKEAAPKGA